MGIGTIIGSSVLEDRVSASYCPCLGVKRNHRHRRRRQDFSNSFLSLLPLVAILLLAMTKTSEGLAFRPPSRFLQVQYHSLSSKNNMKNFRKSSDYNKYSRICSSKIKLLVTTHDDDVRNIQSNRQRKPSLQKLSSQQAQLQLETLSRILFPSLLSSAIAFAFFPSLALGLSYLINDSATFAVLSVDSSQFIQNFLTVTGLTFSILIGQTYYFMYQQQEAVFVSLFFEVTEAKSLLEQVALVSQGRKEMYEMCLIAVKRYVEEDLKKGLGREPAKVLSARPVDDPLEIIMYMTSVGIPSSIYDTVRSLRQARARRLGALQKKLPSVHLQLLWLLAVIELSSFPVLGAGTQTIGGYNILTIEGILFGIMTFGIVLTLNIVGELYSGSGGAYNVDTVLRVMVGGLDEELETRMNDLDAGITRGVYMSDKEWAEIDKRQETLLSSPPNVPMRYSQTYFGEDSIEANSI